MLQNVKVSKIILYAILYLLTSVFIISLIQYHGLANERSGLIHMTDFDAHKPFMYRVLMPSIIRVIDTLTPASIKDKVDKQVTEIVIDKQKTAYADTPEKIKFIQEGKGYRISVYQVLNLLSLFMFLVSLRFLAKTLVDFPESVYDILPLGMAVVIPIFFGLS